MSSLFADLLQEISESQIVGGVKFFGGFVKDPYARAGRGSCSDSGKEL